MSKLTSGRLIENGSGDKLNGASTSQHTVSHLLTSMSHIRGQGVLFWHFDKLIFTGFQVKAEIEMSFFAICTFDLKESTFYMEDLFRSDVRAYCILYILKSL